LQSGTVAFVDIVDAQYVGEEEAVETIVVQEFG
jgi:hypothetical protein